MTPRPRIFQGWPRGFPAEHDPAIGYPSAAENAHDGDTFYAWVMFAPEVYDYRAIRVANVDAAELREPGGLQARGILHNLILGTELGRHKGRMLYKTFDRWATFSTLADGRDLTAALLASNPVDGPVLFKPWDQDRRAQHLENAGVTHFAEHDDLMRMLSAHGAEAEAAASAMVQRMARLRGGG